MLDYGSRASGVPMVIFEELRLIFFHIRKTAGQSMAGAFAPDGDRHHPFCFKEGHPHETVSDFIARLGEDVYRSYRTFCVVRHPFDRFISQYKFLKMRQDRIAAMRDINDLHEFIAAIQEDRQMHIVFAGGEKTEGLATLARPQHEYVCRGPGIAVDHVFRFENLREEWPEICATLGITLRPLPVSNVSKPVPLTIDMTVHDFVSDYYHRDFQTFDYGAAI